MAYANAAYADPTSQYVQTRRPDAYENSYVPQYLPQGGQEAPKTKRSRSSSSSSYFSRNKSAAGGIGDVERQQNADPEFIILGLPLDTVEIRAAFARKVFALTFICLGISFSFCIAATTSSTFAIWLYDNYWLSVVGMIGALGFALALICKRSLARKTPTNYILLFCMALCYGLMLGYVGASYPAPEIGLAMGVCAGTTLICMLIGCQTKYDITGWLPYVCVAIFIFLFMGLFGWFIRSEVYHIVYSSIGCLIFSFLIILDTQMIIGGKRKFQYGLDDYVPAAISLYTDIINLFLYILRIIGIAGE